MIFLIVAILQVFRAVGKWPLQVFAFDIPIWVSWVTAVIAVYLFFEAFRLATSGGE